MTVSSFQTLGEATEKARLPKLSLVLGTLNCYEMDDLSCIWIFERRGDYSQVARMVVV